MDIVSHTVAMQHSQLILDWINSTAAREFSQSQNEISIDEHNIWLRSRILKGPLEPFWIVSLDKNYVGYVRLDLLNGNRDLFTVSILVLPEFQRAGIGTQILSDALKTTVEHNPKSSFRAIIKKNNLGSIQLFQRQGFQLKAEIDANFNEYRLTAREFLEKCD